MIRILRRFSKFAFLHEAEPVPLFHIFIEMLKLIFYARWLR
jgi:hypothetical protein